jgi:ribosomal protein S18 acetylase RimI-like enzyme
MSTRTWRKVEFQAAAAADAADLVALREEVSRHLTAQYGIGLWSSRATEKGILFAMRRSTVYVARHQGRLVATFALSTRKPWAIDRKYFSASARPLYLTGMEVPPDQQRQGLGRRCIDEIRRLGTEWPADAIRLDAWDAAAGAGEFYRKCGFREVGRATYRKAPLVYFEMLL